MSLLNVPTAGEPAASDSAAAPGSLLTRRALLKRMGAYAVAPLGAGIYASHIEPFWPQFHEVRVPIRRLPPAFQGYRIAQLTDLHAGEVPMSFIRSVVQRVQEFRPDLLAVTGDFTHHDPEMLDPVCSLIASTNVPAVFTFGNHEYGVERPDGTCPELSELAAAAIDRHNHTLLRNSSMRLTRQGGGLTLVGMDDLWYGNFDPVAAFADVQYDGPVIVFSHNPDTAGDCDAHRPDLILAGHTHGGQIRMPLLGALYLNTINRQFDQGQFQLPHSTLYVSRGVGYIRQLRFCCRPEIPIFRLEAA